MRHTYLLVLLAFAGGCSFQASCGDKKLDMKKGAAQLEAVVEKEAGVPVDKVDCPKDVKIKAGDIFDCSVVLGGVAGAYRITQTDDKGNINYKLHEGWVLSHKLEPQIAEMLKKQTTVDAKVDCGERVRASKIDTRFECRATAPNGDVLLVGLTVTDTNGGVDIKILGKAGPPANGGAPPTPPAQPAPGAEGAAQQTP